MLTLEQIKEKLKDRNLSEVARQTRISYTTLHNLKTAESLDNYLFATIQKLSEYLGA